MIKLRNTRLAAATAIAALGIGAVAVPSAALAAAHPSKAKVVRTDKQSPDKPGTKDVSQHDSKLDTASSIDNPLDR
ncbi:MAG TPA: hypothetical protein VKG38_10530 [Solirubrobacteraceae bacterium]|nr:hypothetical protein [Solirubrobacteraceae bacterium]